MGLNKLAIAVMMAALAAVAGCSLTQPAPPPPPRAATPPPVTLPPAASEAFVQVGSLNLRQCPTRECRIIALLHKGQGVRVLSQRSGWAEVALPDGRQGWLAAGYLGASPAVSGQGQGPRVPREEFAAPEPPAAPQEEFAR